MVKGIKHRNAGNSSLSMLTIPEIWVEVIDPAQIGCAVVERERFYTIEGAKKYIERQKKVDPWNSYELVYR